MLIPAPVLAELELQLGTPGQGLRVVEVPADVDPLDLVRAGAAATAFAAYFSSPRSGDVGALGAAHRSATAGPDRFADLDLALHRLPAGAPVLAGFGFGDDRGRGAWAEFSAAEIVLPEVTVVRRGGASRLVVAIPPVLMVEAPSSSYPDWSVPLHLRPGTATRLWKTVPPLRTTWGGSTRR